MVFSLYSQWLLCNYSTSFDSFNVSAKENRKFLPELKESHEKNERYTFFKQKR